MTEVEMSGRYEWTGEYDHLCESQYYLRIVDAHEVLRYKHPEVRSVEDGLYAIAVDAAGELIALADDADEIRKIAESECVMLSSVH